MWVLGHEADLDADFLALYGIDLEEQDLSGPRFFQLAFRITAYGGVMAHRQQEANETGQPAASPSCEPDTREVDLTDFRIQFPGVISVGNAGD